MGMYISWCRENIKRDQLFSISYNKISKLQRQCMRAYRVRQILGSSGPCTELPTTGNKDIVHPALASLCEKHKISVRHIPKHHPEKKNK